MAKLIKHKNRKVKNKKNLKLYLLEYKLFS